MDFQELLTGLVHLRAFGLEQSHPPFFGVSVSECFVETVWLVFAKVRKRSQTHQPYHSDVSAVRYLVRLG